MAPVPDPFDAHLTDGILRLAALAPLVRSNVTAQRAALQEHLGKAEEAVVLDLGRAGLVDSLGLALMVGLYKACLERRLAFSVAGASPEVLRLLRFFNLNEIFDIRGK